MATDAHDDFVLYLGTSTGQVVASIDEGDNWTEIANYPPPTMRAGRVAVRQAQTRSDEAPSGVRLHILDLDAP